MKTEGAAVAEQPQFVTKPTTPPETVMLEIMRASDDMVSFDGGNAKAMMLRRGLETLRSEVAVVEAWPKPAVIKTEAEFNLVTERMLTAKKIGTGVGDFFGPFTSFAFKFHRKLTGLQNDELKPLAEYEEAAKKSRQGYLAEQEKIRVAKENELRRIEAERAAKERAALEEKARVERERLDKQAAEAEAKGNAERAEALRQRGIEQEQERLAQAAAVVEKPVYVASTVPQSAKGVTEKMRWVGEVTDPRAAIAIILTWPDWSAYVTLNQAQLNNFASRTKNTVPVAGIEFKNVPVTSVSGK